MFSPKDIMILNLIFSSSLGIVALVLLVASMRRTPEPKRGNLFLCVRRDGILFRKVPIRMGQYRIGRGRGCDILLEGIGIPLVAGELIAEKRLFFRTAPGYPVTKNNQAGSGEFEVEPGDEVGFFDYCLRLENA